MTKTFDRTAHLSPLYKELKILKIDDLYNIAVSTYMYKLVSLKGPIQLREHMQSIQINHNYNTRGSRDYIQKPNYIKQLSTKAILYKGPNIWNLLSIALKSSENENKLRRALKSSFIESY
jgi:hypothetical protein